MFRAEQGSRHVSSTGRALQACCHASPPPSPIAVVQQLALIHIHPSQLALLSVLKSEELTLLFCLESNEGMTIQGVMQNYSRGDNL